MPSPRYLDSGYDPLEVPDRAIEILGRGPTSRKSKTLIRDGELAMLLGLVAQHVEHIESTLRRLHAHHHQVSITVEDEDGHQHTEMVPEILEPNELRAKYPIIAKWERFHQEQVEHYASIGGFSVHAAFRDQDPPQRDKKEDSSAGADRRPQERWR